MAKQHAQQGKNNINYQEKLRDILKKKGAVVHFSGIGGVSMYSLARLSLELGISISGSDRFHGDRVHDLILRGVSVSTEHSADNVRGADVLVYTHAIGEKNPELMAASELGILAVSRAVYMGYLMMRYKSRIGVSGSHGKSTTTAILERIFSEALTDPSVLSGASLECGEPIKLGGDDVLIYEACEYKDSFLSFSPSVAIALNLELDHTDYFENIEALRVSFEKAMSRASKFTIINSDDENLAKIVNNVKKKTKVVTFGQNPRADYRYFVTSFAEVGFEFSLYKFGDELACFKLNIPGIHNVSNAVAAIITAIEFGIDIPTIRRAVSAFSGIAGRLEKIGERRGRTVYYDYAHHPTEIAASINAVKLLCHEPVTVVFKPHTFSRTKSLWEDFRSSLSLADYVILTDIYPAREDPIEGVNSRRLAEEIGEHAVFSPDSEVTARLDEQSKGCIVLMGAGNLDAVRYDVLNK
ncbi:MAG: UDP-N-acetylmuramate--L-alanine ligase [Clostridia bacterium]|nr:UDP-N-acetylmuramate--L-alanine ligase [Clostridia bacterium]